MAQVKTSQKCYINGVMYYPGDVFEYAGKIAPYMEFVKTDKQGKGEAPVAKEESAKLKPDDVVI